MITIYILQSDGKQYPFEIPVDINLSLMEALRAGSYPLIGTCGGIALCATCAVDVLWGAEKLTPPMDQELDMLDLLPERKETTRLACQIRLCPEIDGMVIKMVGPDKG